MAIRWHLKKYLASKYSIFTAVSLQVLVAKKTGIIISHSNLCRYLNQQPKSVKLEVLELFCTALQCDLAEFFTIHPKEYKKVRSLPKKHSPQTTTSQKIRKRAFPDPADYET